MPEVLNPVPVELTPEIVTLEFPVFVTLTFCEAVAPSFTFPKATFVVLVLRVRVGTAPAPVKLIVKSEFGALLTSEMDPATAPVVLGPKVALKLADLPGWTVMGMDIPLMLNPFKPPVIVTCEIVKTAFPGFEICIGCELVLPSATFPKFTFAGLTEICACAPAPLTGTVIAGVDPLLAMEMLPETLPTAVGANCTVKLTFDPALIVAGIGGPLTVIPEPLAVALDTVIIVVPEFVSTRLLEALPPTLTLPKLIDVGAALRPGVVPVPVKDMVAGEFEASLTSENVPLAAPAACGAN